MDKKLNLNYYNNIEKRREYQKQYYKKNKSKIKLYQIEYNKKKRT